MSPLKTKYELRILTPIGMLGYSYLEQPFWDTVEERHRCYRDRRWIDR